MGFGFASVLFYKCSKKNKGDRIIFDLPYRMHNLCLLLNHFYIIALFALFCLTIHHITCNWCRNED